MWVTLLPSLGRGQPSYSNTFTHPAGQKNLLALGTIFGALFSSLPRRRRALGIAPLGKIGLSNKGASIIDQTV